MEGDNVKDKPLQSYLME